MTNLRGFIDALFEPEAGEAVCLSVPVQHKDKQSWRSYAWSDELAAHLDANPGPWYVCGSTVRVPDEPEAPLRRRAVDLTAFWVLMLDDIGTKATAPAVAPSARLETSAGNEQWLYLLQPVDVTEVAARELVKGYQRALADKGWSDPGTLGAGRVFRVPGSVNVKPGRDGFRTRVLAWEPKRVWDFEALMRELDVTAAPSTRATFDQVPGGQQAAAPPDPVHQWLVAHGRLGESRGDWIDTKCPWQGEHTPGGDDRAGYSPLGHGQYPLERGFRCFHAHCADRTIRHFLLWVSEQGGPTCEAVGVREYTATALQATLAEARNPDDNTRLLHAMLPYIPPQKLPDLKANQKGEPAAQQRQTKLNVLTIVRGLGVETRCNMMTHRTEYRFTDETLAALAPGGDDVRRAVVDGCLKVGIPTNQIDTVLDEIGRHTPYHPMVEWVDSRPWDGHSRFEHLLATMEVGPEYFGVWPVYLRRWLIQAMQAIHGWADPQQLPGVLVLQGEEGVMKSRWLASLVPARFFSGGVALHLGGYNEKDSVMRATKTPLVELGELDTTFSASDLGALRAYLTNNIDSYRIPGAHGHPQDYPRTTVYAATVNRLNFLTEPTSNRRFWPVQAVGATPTHDVDMQQLWAEAKTWWAAGEQWWLTEDEERARIEKSEVFRYKAPAAEMLDAYFAEHDDGTTKAMNASMFCRDCINVAANTANVQAVRNALTWRLGPAKRIKSLQNAWDVPTRHSGHQHLQAVARGGER